MALAYNFPGKLRNGFSENNYTYTGDSQLVNDGAGWKLRLLTSGSLTMATNVDVDIFIVGAGGGGAPANWGFPGSGGAGGYTKTISGVMLPANTAYIVTIGAGGTSGQASNAQNCTFTSGGTGGSTTFGNYTANGGGGGVHFAYDSDPKGGDGGCGGGGNRVNGNTGSGGSDGSDGQGSIPGTGQGTTTREFGESAGALYAGGGGAGYGVQSSSSQYSQSLGGEGGGGDGNNSTGTGNINGEANTGGGGGGGSSYNSGGVSSTYPDGWHFKAGTGGSGIVIIRNAR